MSITRSVKWKFILPGGIKVHSLPTLSSCPAQHWTRLLLILAREGLSLAFLWNQVDSKSRKVFPKSMYRLKQRWLDEGKKKRFWEDDVQYSDFGLYLPILIIATFSPVKAIRIKRETMRPPKEEEKRPQRATGMTMPINSILPIIVEVVKRLNPM